MPVLSGCSAPRLRKLLLLSVLSWESEPWTGVNTESRHSFISSACSKLAAACPSLGTLTLAQYSTPLLPESTEAAGVLGFPWMRTTAAWPCLPRSCWEQTVLPCSTLKRCGLGSKAAVHQCWAVLPAWTVLQAHQHRPHRSLSIV